MLTVFATNEGMWGNEVKVTVLRQKPAWSAPS